jgi:hypothetical protein
MNIKCRQCGLVNFSNAAECLRCKAPLAESVNITSNEGISKSGFIKRAAICLFVAIAALCAFYLSLIFSATRLTPDEKKTVAKAISILGSKGFTSEARYLNYVTAFRSNDNWLNASVEKENAYAATNFPFEIMTLYPEFFTVPKDDTERAAILLHESRHLKGADEKEAYEFVWKNRNKLGWTSDKYANSEIWQSVRSQTRDNVAYLFTCPANPAGDCTE